MKLQEISEDRLIRELLRGVPAGRDVITGPGDDCAVLKSPGTRYHLLLKTDCVVEGSHFLPTHAPERVGWKAICRALSDIAATGGEPLSALISIFSPPDRTLAFWKGFYRGLRKAARRFNVGIVGGETTRAPFAAASITLLGRVESRHALSRSGGKPGDRLFVTGRLGGSLNGRHLDFVPRLKEGAWLAARKLPSAMMDLSDGLAADLPRLAAASGCGFHVVPEMLPRTAGSTVAAALSDGEDYELLLAVPPSRCARLQAQWRTRFPRLPLTEVGSLVPPAEASSQLPPGFDHFSIASTPGNRRSRQRG